MNPPLEKKILVTGSNGLLGSSFCNFSKYKNILGCSKELLDITSSKSLHKVLDKEKPDIILHTAAFTNVEKCEINPEKSYEVNVLGTKNIVDYCSINNIFLIFISSTGVYGSHKINQYVESDMVDATTIHHKSKHKAELIISKNLNDYLILRTGWLYGGDISLKKNFVYKRYLEANNKKLLYSNNKQIGNPTYVIDLVKQIDLLIDKNITGLFNCVNSAHNVSRFDYVSEIVNLFDLDCIVESKDASHFKRVAPVSNNESAINLNLNNLGLNIMRDWKVSLKEYINTVK